VTGLRYNNCQRKNDVTSRILHRENLRLFIPSKKSLPKVRLCLERPCDLAHRIQSQDTNELRMARSGDDGTVV
jgi:hypothetical protein